jgi:hypothetical protein
MIKVVKPMKNKVYLAAEKNETLQEWHEKMGHQNKKYVHS